MRGSNHQLKHKKFSLNTRKNFFPCMMTKLWNNAGTREVVSLPLETFQTHLDMFPCHLLQVTLPWGVGLVWMISGGLISHPTIL